MPFQSPGPIKEETIPAFSQTLIAVIKSPLYGFQKVNTARKIETKFLAQVEALFLFQSYDSQGFFHWELLYPAIQRGTVYHIDV